MHSRFLRPAIWAARNAPCGVARSRTAPPDKSIGTDARPQTCSRTAPLMPCRRATRMASPPTTGQSLVPSGRHRALDESASRHRLDPASRPQLRYQRARPRPRNSTSYRCARGERIPTDLARGTPSPAPPSPPLFPSRATPAATTTHWRTCIVSSGVTERIPNTN